MMCNNSSFIDNDTLVDIHGRDITTVTMGRDQEAVLLSDLKQTGVGIYKKSQYVKLSKINKEFDEDFVEHMLEAAKTYMLANKVSFNHDELMRSIKNCEKVLTRSEETSRHSEKSAFFKDRTFEQSDDEIRIRVSSTPKEPQSSISEFKSSNHLKKNEKKNPKKINYNCVSESSSLDGSVKDEFENKSFQNGWFDGKCETEKKSFDEKFHQIQNEGRSRRPQQKKKFIYNTDALEIDVFVTHVDKSNCCWVRDKGNTEQMELIHRKVNEEAETRKAVPEEEWVTDKVYAARDEDQWFRCKIVKFTPLTVLFVDYGNITEVTEIRNIPNDLAHFPALAVRITFKQHEYKPQLEDEIRIKKFMQNNDGTYFVNVLGVLSGSCESRSSSSSCNSLTKLTQNLQKAKKEFDDQKKPSESSTNTIEKQDLIFKEVDCMVKQPAFFGKPRPLCSLQNELKVVIIHEANGVFVLRSRECFAKLEAIKTQIEKYTVETKYLQNVHVDQVVLYRNEQDGKLHRAIVSKIVNDEIEIDLLDWVENRTVSKKTLRTISDRLSKEPVTYFYGGKLTGFEQKTFNEDCKNLIRQFIKTKKKFIVSLGFDDELDLFDGNQLLSEQLTKLSNNPNEHFVERQNDGKISLKDMKTYKPEFGTSSYVIGCYNNPNDLSLVPTSQLQKHIDLVLQSEIKDTDVYRPIIGEVCWCYYSECWYRCVVTRIFDKEYEILLLDFGSSHLVDKHNIRKPEGKVTEIPILALPCVLTNIPQHHSIGSNLKSKIIIGEVYKANITKICNGKYQVELPTVYEDSN